MDKAFFEILGRVAGIGGISLGLFYGFLRQVVSSQEWPKQTQRNADRLLRLMLVLAFILSAMGLLSYVLLSFGNLFQKTVSDPKRKVHLEFSVRSPFGNAASSQSAFSSEPAAPPPGIRVVDWEDVQWQEQLRSLLKPGQKVPRLDVYRAFLTHFSADDTPSLSQRFDAAIRNTSTARYRAPKSKPDPFTIVVIQELPIEIESEANGRVFLSWPDGKSKEEIESAYH